MADPIEVFFAANRNLQGGRSPSFGKKFHKDGAELYRVGKAKVERTDEGEYRLASIDVAQERAARSGDDADSKLGSSAVFREIKTQMQEEGRDLIVLIHGYASDFATAPERAAEIADKYVVRGKDGVLRHPVVLAFSWPANGRTVPFASYISDRHDAAKSGRAVGRLFMRLCGFLLDEAKAERTATTGEARRTHAACPNRIHLIAHSMGNWTLRNALQAIIEMRGADRLPAVFDNIFLMAADEDEDSLQDDTKMALLPRLGNAVHVYHSKDDRALVISDTTKLNPDRLGSNGPIDMDLIDAKIVCVDCRHVDETDFLHANHQYYRLREEVIGDVRQVLAGLEAGEVQGRKRLEHRNRYMIAPPI